MLKPLIHAVPTHIIMGSLGAGKTTLLNALLAQKPVGETWAVLINELGQVDIDSSLIASGSTNHLGGIAVKQVIGGCMCCTSYLPMRVALSRLLAQSRPTRLFVEAIGLGHPAQLIQQLSSSHWAQVLALQAVLTVVNATNLDDQRLLGHDIFQAQLSHADVVIVSHADVMQPADELALQHLLQQDYYQNQPVLQTGCGELLFEQINLPHQVNSERQQTSYITLDHKIY